MPGTGRAPREACMLMVGIGPAGLLPRQGLIQLGQAGPLGQ